MKTKFTTAFIFFMIMNAKFSSAQVSTGFNFGSGTNYVGWDVFQSFPLTIKHEAQQPIYFYTNAGSGTLNNMRMQINSSTVTAPNGNNFAVGRVAIRESPTSGWSPTSVPVSLLHLGNGWNSGDGGHRTWMDVGTFTTAGSDNMYVGLKLEGPTGTTPVPWTDFMDAIINWGDNDLIQDSFNDLRFIFTTPLGANGGSDQPEGLEVARMSWNGNVGIGNFYNAANPLNSIRPARRFEVLDGQRNQPQFRLTHTQQNGAGTGRYTDFETTNLGNLFINPMFNASPANVGIGTNGPTAKLHVVAPVLTTAGNVWGQKIQSTQTLAGINRVLEINANGGNSELTGIFATISNATNNSFGAYIINSSSAGLSSGSAYGVSSSITGDNKINFGFSASVTGRSSSNYGINTLAMNAVLNYGGYFQANGINQDDKNYGVYARIKLSNPGSDITNVGVFGEVLSSGTNHVNHGVSGIASGSVENIGVRGAAYGIDGAITYGIYGEVSSPNCENFVDCSQAAGYFNGDVFTTTDYFRLSDKKFKTNIKSISNARQIISMLQPSTYEFDSTAFPNMNLGKGTHFGFIAQDVEIVIPEIVKSFIQPAKRDSLGKIVHPQIDFRAINYDEFIPIIIAALNDQQNEIDSLKSVIVNGPISTPNSTNRQAGNLSIKLSDKLGVILDQNDPNPYTESTTINYFIPEQIKDAKIIFSNSSGIILRTVEINTRGEGSLDVYASELSSGVYTYTLITDGKVIESKKMIKQ